MTLIVCELSENDDYYQYCCLLKQLTTINPENITQEQFLTQLSLIKSNPLHKIIICKLDDKIIGTTTVLIEPKFIHDLSRVAHIEDVVIDSTYRSLGVDRSLITQAIEIGKEYGCYKIILDCTLANANFYRKFGFDLKESQMTMYLNK